MENRKEIIDGKKWDCVCEEFENIEIRVFQDKNALFNDLKNFSDENKESIFFDQDCYGMNKHRPFIGWVAKIEGKPICYWRMSLAAVKKYWR